MLLSLACASVTFVLPVGSSLEVLFSCNHSSDFFFFTLLRILIIFFGGGQVSPQGLIGTERVLLIRGRRVCG